MHTYYILFALRPENVRFLTLVALVNVCMLIYDTFVCFMLELHRTKSPSGEFWYMSVHLWAPNVLAKQSVLWLWDYNDYKRLCKTHHARDNSMFHHPLVCVSVMEAGRTPVWCIPLSQRELYWSVLMAVCFPSVRKMAESVPIKSMYTPA